MNELIQF